MKEFMNVPTNEPDIIKNPGHYQSKSGLEVKEVIRAFTEDLTGWEAVCTGNILKYVCRWKKKNGIEDLKKAREYINYLIYDVDYSENEVKYSEPVNPISFYWSQRFNDVFYEINYISYYFMFYLRNNGWAEPGIDYNTLINDICEYFNDDAIPTFNKITLLENYVEHRIYKNLFLRDVQMYKLILNNKE